MDELDKILISRDVHLDGGGGDGDGYTTGDDKSESGLSVRSGMSNGSGYLRREKFTESIIRNDAFAPHVVHFTHTYNPHKKYRRLTVLLVIIVLSVSGILHLRKLVRSFSHEAYLDIEVKMAATSNEQTVDGADALIP